MVPFRLLPTGRTFVKAFLAAMALLGLACVAAAVPSATEGMRGVHPAVVRVMVPNRIGTSYGSGALVAANPTHGLVVTNWHVVREASGPITVAFPDGWRSGASVLKVDPDWDLAALVIWRPNAAPIPLSAEAPRPGEMLTIAGYGKGWYQVSSGRCTQYVSPGGNLPFEMVELATAAREGDSGGPILNSRGELAGVLFGAAFGRTTGSYCGRVRWFLTSAVDDLKRLPDPQTMLAQQPPVPVQPATVAAHAPPGSPPTSRDEAPGISLPPENPSPSPAPALVRVAGMTGTAPSATGQVAAIRSPAPVSPPPLEAAAGRFELVKTILAAIGALLLLWHGVRLLGWAIG